MKVEFLRSWQAYKPGTILASMPDGMANVLRKRGILKEVKEQPQKYFKGKK